LHTLAVITDFQKMKNKVVIYKQDIMRRETVQDLAFVWGGLGLST